MYYVYVLRCEDNTLYTGIAADWEKRFEEHRSQGKKCAKYTRSHKAVSVEALWQTESKSCALKTERFFKSLTKQTKEEIIKKPQKLCELIKAKYDEFEIGITCLN